MARRGDLLVCWPGELKLRTDGGPVERAGAVCQDGKDQVGRDGGPGRVRARRGLAISGRQLAHDLLQRVLLPRSHVDAGPSCSQRGPQDSQTTWIKACRL